MKRMFSAMAALLLLGTVLLVSCTGQAGTTYIVVTDPQNGTPPTAQTVAAGAHATEPVFSYGNRRLTGWARDQEGTQPFDFSDEPVTRSLTVYAIWEAETERTLTQTETDALLGESTARAASDGVRRTALTARVCIRQEETTEQTFPIGEDGTIPMENYQRLCVRFPDTATLLQAAVFDLPPAAQQEITFTYGEKSGDLTVQVYYQTPDGTHRLYYAVIDRYGYLKGLSYGYAEETANGPLRFAVYVLRNITYTN